MDLEAQIIRAYLCLWLGLFGAVWGSFANCAVSRWAAGERMFAGRSRCFACGHTLSAGDLVPVLSWLFRRGRCRYCGAPIPADCLVSELAGAAGLVCVAWRFGAGLETGQWAVWWAILLCLSLADGAKRELPGPLLWALAGNRLVWFLLLRQGAGALAEMGKSFVLPAVLLVLVLLVERRLGREVLGGGDIKLLFALALYMTWAQQLLGLLAGCLLGLIWAAGKGKKRGTAVPFGPFLATGALLAVCFGDPLIGWYLGLF